MSRLIPITTKSQSLLHTEILKGKVVFLISIFYLVFKFTIVATVQSYKLQSEDNLHQLNDDKIPRIVLDRIYLFAVNIKLFAVKYELKVRRDENKQQPNPLYKFVCVCLPFKWDVFALWLSLLQIYFFYVP